MKTALLILVVAICLLLPPRGVSALEQGSDARPLAVTGVTVIDGAGTPPQSDFTVLIRNGRIEALGRAISIPDDARIIDGRGKYLIPGLWDMHIHLTLAGDQTLTREVMLPMLVASGIVGVRDMGGDWERIAALRSEIAQGRIVGPRIIAPGPFIDGPQDRSRSLIPVSGKADARLAVGEVQALGVDFVKVQSTLSPAAYRAVIEEARRRSMPVAGHVPESVSAFDAARSGQRSIEHVSPILPGDASLLLACSSDEARLRKELLEITRLSGEANADRVGLRARRRALQVAMVESFDARKATRLFSLLARNRVRVVPTMIWSTRVAPLSSEDLPSPSLLEFVPGAMRNEWRARRLRSIESSSKQDFELRRRLSEKSLELVGTMHRSGVHLLAGTDSMDAYVLPGTSLHEELELLARAGLSPLEALRCATMAAAEFLGEADTRGTIEKGKAADLVLIDGNPVLDIRNTRRISAVILGGRYIEPSSLVRSRVDR